MNDYNASTPPNPKDWLAMDESQRLDLLYNFVEKHENLLEEEAQRIHAAIHVIVENQLALNTELTIETYNRLKRQGLDRHEIIHAIGAVIFEDIFEIMNNDIENPFEKYKLRLKKLTAKRWKMGKW